MIVVLMKHIQSSQIKVVVEKDTSTINLLTKLGFVSIGSINAVHFIQDIIYSESKESLIELITSTLNIKF